MSQVTEIQETTICRAIAILLFPALLNNESNKGCIL